MQKKPFCKTFRIEGFNIVRNRDDLIVATLHKKDKLWDIEIHCPKDKTLTTSRSRNDAFYRYILHYGLKG